MQKIVIPTIEQIIAEADVEDLSEPLSKLTPGLNALRSAVAHLQYEVAAPLASDYLPKEVRKSLTRVVKRAYNAAIPTVDGIVAAIPSVSNSVDAETFAKVVACFNDILLVAADFIESAATTIHTALKPIAQILDDLKYKHSSNYKSWLNRYSESVSDDVEDVLTQGFSDKEVKRTLASACSLMVSPQFSQ